MNEKELIATIKIAVIRAIVNMDEEYLLNLVRNVLAESEEEKTRKKGHWILLDECVNSGYYCSECQKKVVKEGWSDTVKKIKFCPNCGADMREAEE